MNVFPTKTAVALAKASDLDKLFSDVQQWRTNLGIFQQMALGSSLEICMRAIMPHIDKQLNDQHKKCFELIHGLSRQEALGIAIGGLVDIVENSRVAKDRAAAAAIINELFGEKQLIQDDKLTDKLVVNLVKDN